jgi:hypothetical protein
MNLFISLYSKIKGDFDKSKLVRKMYEKEKLVTDPE